MTYDTVLADQRRGIFERKGYVCLVHGEGHPTIDERPCKWRKKDDNA